MSAILAYLPVDIADPVDRLTAVRTELAALKASGEAAAIMTSKRLAWTSRGMAAPIGGILALHRGLSIVNPMLLPAHHTTKSLGIRTIVAAIIRGPAGPQCGWQRWLRS